MKRIRQVVWKDQAALDHQAKIRQEELTRALIQVLREPASEDLLRLVNRVISN